MSKKCAKCQSDIPASIRIDGKKRNLCSRKYCFVCSPWGSKNSTKLERIKYKQRFVEGNKFIICTDCNQEKPKFKGGRCRDCYKPIWRKKTKKRANQFKIKLAELYGSCCKICGYKKNYAALEFHHRDPKQKDFEFSKIKYGELTEVVLTELKKCDLLCNNCHRKAHQIEMPKYLNVRDNPNFLEIKNHNLKNKTHSICATCNQIKEKELFGIYYGQHLDTCKLCRSGRVVSDQRKNKEKYASYLGGKCNICGHDDICVLDFHHKNPADKKFAIASKKFVKMTNEIKQELDKCELLCGNCHREVECPDLTV